LSLSCLSCIRSWELFLSFCIMVWWQFSSSSALITLSEMWLKWLLLSSFRGLFKSFILRQKDIHTWSRDICCPIIIKKIRKPKMINPHVKEFETYSIMKLTRTYLYWSHRVIWKCTRIGEMNMSQQRQARHKNYINTKLELALQALQSLSPK
jgi:hypothetical protein